MNGLFPDTRLEYARDLRVRLGSEGAIEITVPNGPTVRGGPHTLDVLGAFVRPSTFQEAMTRLTPRAAGAANWVALSETIRALVEVGALVGANLSRGEIKAGVETFSGAPVHIRMLNDRLRTSRFIAAIEQVVRPGDIVVEVGTGTGVLAVAAARAGAKHVYTIEAGAMAVVARELVKANGLTDRITVVEGWSTVVTLPEKGDVFISETIGSMAFDENLLGIARDAVERHLKPGARMIPETLRLMGLPVAAPAEWMSRQCFTPAAVEDWQAWYGIDFGVLCALPVSYGTRRAPPRSTTAAWPPLGAPVLLAQATLTGRIAAEMERTESAVMNAAGEFNALVLFFETQVAPGITLSTDPRLPAVDFPESWANPLCLVSPVSVSLGDNVRVNFTWDEQGGRRCTVAKLTSAEV